MIRRLWNAYAVEVVKALRLKQTYIGPLLVLAVVLCGPWMREVSHNGASDYGFIAYITSVSLNFLGFVLLLTYCAGLISSEMANGSIRSILVRPLRRFEYVLAKLFLAFTYALALTVTAAAGAWAMAFARGELAGVTFGGELLFTSQQMEIAYGLGALLSLAPQFAAASYAVMISAATRNVGGAVGGTLGLWILLDIIKNPLHIEGFVFSSYLESPFQVFSNQCDGLDGSWFPMTAYCLGTSAGTLILCTVAAILLLNRRNLTA